MLSKMRSCAREALRHVQQHLAFSRCTSFTLVGPPHGSERIGGEHSPISAVFGDITETAAVFWLPPSLREAEAGCWKLRGSRNGSAARPPIARLAARMARPEWCTSCKCYSMSVLGPMQKRRLDGFVVSAVTLLPEHTT